MIKVIPSGISPKISVITVSFNQAEFIRDNIESVLAQNYPNFEHHIIDGGSTDGTIEILKSYPHLNWTSESDRGQTHALNKGFRRASGDIIAWINSDDFYPNDVFHFVSEALRDAPIVMGACQNVDKQGKPFEYVENAERNWFDILKYWIFFSSPAQPSIFFRRELLEQLVREDGNYLDEGLEFCMDWEFWLRSSKKYPLNKRLDKVLSYNRVYETAKTGRDMASVYREMSRVFSRHSNIATYSERKLSIVIPFEEINQSVRATVSSALTQKLRDFEIVLVDYNKESSYSKDNRREVIDLEKSQNLSTIRYVRSLDTSLYGAINQGIKQACAPYLACVLPGSIIGSELSFQVNNIFREDIFGLALPNCVTNLLPSLIQQGQDGRNSFNIAAVLSTPHIPEIFVARTVALQEVGDFQLGAFEPFAFNQILLKLVYKGWHINLSRELQIENNSLNLAPRNQELYQLYGEFILSKLVIDLNLEFEKDQFGKVRAQHGFALVFPPELVSKTEEILSRAPEGWIDSIRF